MSDELDNLAVVNFTNIDGEDYEGMWGGEAVILKAGITKQFPKFLAEHYCKHLVNKMLIRQGKDWSEEALRKPLEEKILGKIEVEAEEDKPVFVKGGPIGETPAEFQEVENLPTLQEKEAKKKVKK